MGQTVGGGRRREGWHLGEAVNDGRERMVFLGIGEAVREERGRKIDCSCELGGVVAGSCT